MEVEVPTQPISISLPAKFRLFPPDNNANEVDVECVLPTFGLECWRWFKFDCLYSELHDFQNFERESLCELYEVLLQSAEKKKKKIMAFSYGSDIICILINYSFFVSNSKYTIILKGSSSQKRNSPEQGTINTL